MSQAFKEAKKYSKSSNEVVGIYKANILPNVAFSAKYSWHSSATSIYIKVP
jgi:outer membrane protein TolC